VHHLNDPDLDRIPPPTLLAIDWSTVKLSNDAEALQVWNQIAPTGEDWQQRLDEIPSAAARPLALALLREGHFDCGEGPSRCGHAVGLKYSEPNSTLADPCLRRELAMWSLDQLDPTDVPKIGAALKKIASLPPPESQLVAEVIKRVEFADPDLRLEVLATAAHAGQGDLANADLGGFDEAHLIIAAEKLHLDGALDGLSAKTQRAVFLKAIADDKLAASTRAQAMAELVGDDDKLAPDLKAALVAVTKSANCDAAAAAALVLVRHGSPNAVPARPATTNPTAIVHGLCVVGAYEAQMRSDEASPLSTFLPAHGLEVMHVVYDPYSDTDPDGDGDVHTTHEGELMPRANATLPESTDFARALQHCVKLTCSSEDHDFKLIVTNGLFARVEIIDRPGCPAP
jgi:hypothetical protein